MGKLSGENVLITGASRGLGRVFALHLASLGANIGIIHRDLHTYQAYPFEAKEFKADTVLEELAAYDVKVSHAVADVTNREELFAAVEHIKSELGPITILVCNAGGGEGEITAGQPSTMDLDQFDRVIKRNLYGTAYTISAVVPMMKENRKGKVVTLISHTGQSVNSSGSYSHYAAAKAGIMMYTKSLAMEVGEYGITANCLSPGFILTGRLQQRFETAGTDMVLKNVPLKRFGSPEDCAKALEFLVSPESDYVTAMVMEVNGGTLGKIMV